MRLSFTTSASSKTPPTEWHSSYLNSIVSTPSYHFGEGVLCLCSAMSLRLRTRIYVDFFVTVAALEDAYFYVDSPKRICQIRGKEFIGAGTQELVHHTCNEASSATMSQSITDTVKFHLTTCPYSIEKSEQSIDRSRSALLYPCVPLCTDTVGK
jgi:hypothetical protein